MPQTLSRYVYCANNPLNRVDPTGEVFNLIAAAIGAIGGAIVGAAVGGISAYLMGGDVLAGMAGGAVSGAITGGLAGLTCGASLLLGGNALAGAAGSMVQTGIETGRWDYETMGKAAALGAFSGAIGFGAGAAAVRIGAKISSGAAGLALRSLSSNIQSGFSKTFPNAAKGILGRLANGVEHDFSSGFSLLDDTVTTQIAKGSGDFAVDRGTSSSFGMMFNELDYMISASTVWSSKMEMATFEGLISEGVYETMNG